MSQRDEIPNLANSSNTYHFMNTSVYQVAHSKPDPAPEPQRLEIGMFMKSGVKEIAGFMRRGQISESGLGGLQARNEPFRKEKC